MSDEIRVFTDDLELLGEIVQTRGVADALVEAMHSRGVLLDAIAKAYASDELPLHMKVALGGALQDARLK